VSVTVLAIDSVEAEQDGGASVRRFLNADTVGAQLVEGLAYELPPGGRLGPREAVERYEVLYVTSGRLTALFRGATHDLRAGQGVYCEPGEACEVENATGMPATFYRFFVNPA
jgi:quercetin dioxygenase-like cupin family protein